ncbi:MAG: ParB N-terminal domain-containing protein [Lachnospiraceae bacterium]|nr:ParB N-terminal domain-containing protein [Lachnospiraceae bacterium]
MDMYGYQQDVMTYQEEIYAPENDRHGVLMVANITDIVDFKNHTFTVEEDSDMEELRDSIRENGVDSPGIAFYNEYGELELIAGHRRKYILNLLGISEMPVIIKQTTRANAVRIMVESNLQNRKNIKPSVLARSYKALLDALKAEGKQQKFVNRVEGMDTMSKEEKRRVYRTKDKIEKMLNKSYSSINQYIHLLTLDERLLERVDERKMGIKPAVDIAHFDTGIQSIIYDLCNQYDISPSHAQTRAMRKLYDESMLDEEAIAEILEEDKPNQKGGFKINERIYETYLSNCSTNAEVENRIIKALELLTRQERIMRKETQREEYTQEI